MDIFERVLYFSFFRFFGVELLGLFRQLFFSCFGCGEFRLETVNATFGVDDFFFTGKERVGSGRNVDFYEGVLVAVFPFDSIVCLRG